VALVGLDPHYVEQAGGDISAVQCVIPNDTASFDLTQRATEAPFLVVNAFGSDPEVREDASPMRHIDDRDELPDFLVVRRGLADRRAAQTEFADALEAAGGKVGILDTPGYTHGDVNRRLGEPGETVLSPAITDFTRHCLGR
jgi:hypothetical protein